ADIRPLVRLNVSIVVGEGERMETGSHGAGGRVSYEYHLDPNNWKAQVDEALRQALVNLGSVPAPAGEMTVVLGPGWPGVMLHEIPRSVKHGRYAVNFGGGSVDITSGKFVFSASEAYLIEDGKIGPAVKGATLIGNGPDAMNKVTMIGNDLKLDDGVGTCGKDGQGVPVGVGQPTLRMDGLTVGGTMGPPPGGPPPGP